MGEHLENNAYKIYPNPSNGNFEVSFTLSETENVLVQVLNNLGQVVLVRDEKLLAGNNTVSFSGVESGLYFVKVSTNNSSTVVRLLVK